MPPAYPVSGLADNINTAYFDAKMTSNYPLSPRLLRSFLLVAGHGHYRQAAEVGGIAQPLLTRHVQQLEAELGCQLFERSTKRVRLTDAGEYLARRAPEIAGLSTEIVTGCRAASAGQAGLLRIGYSGAAMSGFLSLALRRLQKQRPALELSLHEGNSQELVDGLLAGRHDLAFPLMASDNPAITSVRLAQERIGLVVPDDHPLAVKPRPRLADVRGERVILFPRRLNPVLHDEITHCCRKAGFTAHIVAEASPRPAAISLVAAGQGVTFLSDRLAHLCTPGTVHRKLSGETPKITFIMARQSHRRIPAAAELASLIKSILA